MAWSFHEFTVIPDEIHYHFGNKMADGTSYVFTDPIPLSTTPAPTDPIDMYTCYKTKGNPLLCLVGSYSNVARYCVNLTILYLDVPFAIRILD